MNPFLYLSSIYLLACLLALQVSPLVTSVLDGYNVCIFAYGQTGSGKTFTMTGPEVEKLSGQGMPESLKGVNTRALEELFARSQERSAEIR